MSKTITQLTRLALLAALALPGLVSAQGFGVRITDGLSQGYPIEQVTAKVTASSDTSISDSAAMGTGTLSGVASANASASVALTNTDPGNLQTGTASVSASASAAMGALGASASLFASSSDTSAVTAHEFSNRAEVGFSTNAYDDISLLSATRANGSFVDVLFTMTLDSLVSESGSTMLGGGGVNATLIFNDEGGPDLFLKIQDNDFQSPGQRTLTQTVALQIGRTYQLWHELSIFASGIVRHTEGGPHSPASWGMDIDAAHTSHAFIDVLAGDVTLSTASGHDYSLAMTAPVPEPETYAMMLAGLGLLGVVARRRKQKLAA